MTTHDKTHTKVDHTGAVLPGLADEGLGAFYLELLQRAATAGSPGSAGVRLFVDTDGKYKAKRNDGVILPIDPSVILTTKGDIFAFDGTKWGRLAIGADALALLADSSKAGGLAWGAPTPAAHKVSHQVGGTDAVGITHTQTTGQGPNDHHPQAHGAADHTDVLRSYYIPSGANAKTDSGTAATLGTAPDQTAGITLADAATQGYEFTWMVPSEVKPGSALTGRPIWAASTVDAVAHTARWSIDVLVINGIDVRNTGTTATFTGDSGTRGAGVEVLETGAQLLASVNPGDRIRINVRRVGGDAADTLTVNMLSIGLQLDVMAVQ